MPILKRSKSEVFTTDDSRPLIRGMGGERPYPICNLAQKG
jgi:hypothetical protein